MNKTAVLTTSVEAMSPSLHNSFFTRVATLLQTSSRSPGLILLNGFDGVLTAWNCASSVSRKAHGRKITDRMLRPPCSADFSKGEISLQCITSLKEVIPTCVQ